MYNTIYKKKVFDHWNIIYILRGARMSEKTSNWMQTRNEEPDSLLLPIFLPSVTSFGEYLISGPREVIGRGTSRRHHSCKQ